MIQPLLSLVEKFEQETRTAGYPNEVQTSPCEYGYAAVIIVLTVMVFESAVNRTRHLRNDSTSSKASTYFTSLVADPWLEAAVPELFVVRDVIAHNHVWEGSIIDDEDGLRYTDGPTLRDGYGDRKYKRFVDLSSRQTTTLHLNVVPTRMWRQDILTVFCVVDRALGALEQLDARYFDATTEAFSFHNEYMSFHSAVERMKRTKLTASR